MLSLMNLSDSPHQSFNLNKKVNIQMNDGNGNSCYHESYCMYEKLVCQEVE